MRPSPVSEKSRCSQDTGFLCVNQHVALQHLLKVSAMTDDSTALKRERASIVFTACLSISVLFRQNRVLPSII